MSVAARNRCRECNAALPEAPYRNAGVPYGRIMWRQCKDRDACRERVLEGLRTRLLRSQPHAHTGQTKLGGHKRGDRARYDRRVGWWRPERA